MCKLKIFLLVLVVFVVNTVALDDAALVEERIGEKEVLEKKVELPSQCGRFLNYKFFRSNKTELTDYPWLVLIEHDTPQGKKVFCGGTLVSNRYVLTAAHCSVSNQNWTVSSVRLGEYDTEREIDCTDEGDIENSKKCAPKTRSIKVDKSIIPDEFKYGHAGHNIGLLRLAEEVVFDDYVQPICLPEKTSFIEKFEVAGWGTLGRLIPSNTKLRSDVTLVNRLLCVDAYKKQKINVTDDQICLGSDPRESVCIADSGGPLMGLESHKDGSFRMTVYGVYVHYYTFCGVTGWPGIFTDAMKYREWIIQNVKRG